ncbi:uncharacterized protein N7529_004181 [Penicillium soppii]|uniref:uncharacterized protein n=1 Tax=Penicillium soppii TaxID=69789 RepID=UPI0025479EC7|nr:uncharacterized protein N7529_004181 [Penicillium soppii]KAJ5871828.1 hypothetical protein N7529_004181 [Penicillium soppii]
MASTRTLEFTTRCYQKFFHLAFLRETLNMQMLPARKEICLTNLAWEKSSAVREIFIHPEASWRRMLTHQTAFHRVGNPFAAARLMALAGVC